MLNKGAFDWVNTMSYHWNKAGDIWAWRKDVWFLLDAWKMDPQRVNLGLGYFSKVRGAHGALSEPTWAALSSRCPNVAYSANECAGTVFVGKKMNCEIGKLAASRNMGGLFPWELSYDSYDSYGGERNATKNNTLVRYLIRGWDDRRC